VAEVVVETRPSGLELINPMTGATLGHSPVTIYIATTDLPYRIQARQGRNLSSSLEVLTELAPPMKKTIILDFQQWVATNKRILRWLRRGPAYLEENYRVVSSNAKSKTEGLYQKDPTQLPAVEITRPRRPAIGIVNNNQPSIGTVDE
jgi:hypothetical protein